MGEIVFPRIEIIREKGEKVPIHIYGFAHGIGIKGSALTRGVGDALKREAATFGQNDYIAMEGTTNSLIRHALRSAGISAGSKVSQDYMREALAPYIPEVIKKAESVEHLDMLRKSLSDSDGRATRQEHFMKREAVHEHPDKLVEFIGKTQITSEEMAAFKQEVVAKLEKAGIEKEKAELYVESQYTFRSLLMARAVRHRAMATGLPVRLFTGFAHTREIVDFLDENKVNAYVKTLPKLLKRLYETYEMYGWGVVDLFEQHAHKFELRHHSHFFRWLAHEVAKAHYETGRTAPVVINVANFRKLLRK